MKGHSSRSFVYSTYRDERGIVLAVVLMFMAILAAMGSVTVMMTRADIKIAGNYKNSEYAFYMAEAGVAIAKDTLRNSVDWNIQLAATQPFNCPAGLVPASDGGCTFTIENDAADPGGATNDTNDTVVVKATGTYRSTVKGVEVAINSLMLPMPPGAITSVGTSSNVSFNGNAFTIDGNNWVPPTDDGSTSEIMNNGACGSTWVPKYGIAVPNETHQLAVRDDLNAPQQDNVIGKDPVWEDGSPVPSIAVDTTINQTELEDLVHKLMPLADSGYKYPPGTHLSSATLGTQADPKIVVVDATSYSGSDPALTLSATKGAGILIVKNGTLNLTGNSQWVGLVIVIGSNVSIEIDGGGNKAIYGSALLAENVNMNANIAEGGGNLKVRYSCQGIDVANAAGGGKLRAATAWWKEVF